MAGIGAGPSLFSRNKKAEKPPQKSRSATRILNEAALMERDPPPGCSARIVEDDIYSWVGCIDGPDDSVYAGGKFRFKMTLPSDYPYSPPKLRFETKIYHPNIQSTGDHKHGFAVCIDILHKLWSPSLSIDKVLLSIRSLFTDPNPEHGLEAEIVMECKTNRAEFERKAKEYTEKYAMGK